MKHFELTPASKERIVGEESEYSLVRNALRSMTRLSLLKLTMGEAYSVMQSFQCSYRCNYNLIRFLQSQPDLATLKLWCGHEGHYGLSTNLPKLTKLDAPISWLSALIPGRPVKEVIFHESSRLTIAIIDITYLVLSLSPIRTLAVGSLSLLALTLSQITSILPTLEKLTIATPHIGTYFHDSVGCSSHKSRSPLTVIPRKQHLSDSVDRSTRVQLLVKEREILL